jgi:hypothetical protein
VEAWLWVTNAENLTDEKWAELQKLKRKFPELAQLADHRKALHQIFQDRQITPPAMAIARRSDRCQQSVQMGLNALAQFSKTLENWMDKIAIISSTA